MSSQEIRDPSEIHERLQKAGVAGAGGAGFPSYVKWQTPDNVDALLVNHQESEPNFYADKWIAKEHTANLESLFDYLLEHVFDLIVISTKEHYREQWTDTLADEIDVTVREPDELPIDPNTESGVVLTYTPNVYTYSEESVLLKVTAGVNTGDDLPTEHGWLVHNTESLYNIQKALFEDEPVTRKFVHVDGEVPHHRCLDVPIGTPASILLRAAGVESGTIPDNGILADGGPGWCYQAEIPPNKLGIRKRTNGILVLDEEVAIQNMGDDDEIDVRKAYDWDDGEHEQSPTSIHPHCVRIPLITNAAYEGYVQPSEPVVEVNDQVQVGDTIAEPATGEISNTQHASIDGAVTQITDTHIIIEQTALSKSDSSDKFSCETAGK